MSVPASAVPPELYIGDHPVVPFADHCHVQYTLSGSGVHLPVFAVSVFPTVLSVVVIDG